MNEDDSDPASPPAPPMKRRRKGKATTAPASSASTSASAASSTSKRGMKTRNANTNANANANISVPEENTVTSSLSAHAPIDFEEQLRKELLKTIKSWMAEFLFENSAVWLSCILVQDIFICWIL